MKLFGKKKSDEYYDFDYDRDYVNDEMAALDDDVTVAEEKLNRSIKRREQAKDTAVKDRIKGETDIYRAENRRLKKILKKMFRKAGRPAFCASNLYYSLFVPYGVKDYLIILLAVAIAFFGIPFVIIKLIDVTTVGKVFIYIGICAIFALVYWTIRRMTKPKLMWEVICKGRPILKKIKHNKKLIKKVSRNIKKDTDESHYNLKEFDNEITRNQGLYDVALARKHSFASNNSQNAGEYDDAFAREPEEMPEEQEPVFRQYDANRDNPQK